MQEQCSRRICSPSAYPRPRVFHTPPLFHSVCQNVFCFFLFLKSHKLHSCRFPVVTVFFFFISKDRQSPNTAEYKEQKKRQKQRLEREKKEQKERERKDNEMRKKFKVCSSKSPLFNVFLSVEMNY